MSRASIISLVLASGGLCAAAALLTAGPLDPPAGPVASTFKTLTDVEPRIALSAANTPGDANTVFVISQPGSYYLTANLTGGNGRHGIKIITSGDVSIDLNGFRMIGGAGSLFGVIVQGGLSNGRLSIRNGAISNWLSGGITADGADRPVHADRLYLHDNSGPGIAAGPNSHITHCVATSNGVVGISVEDFSSVSDCQAHGNGAGFILNDSSTVVNCTATLNTQNGFRSLGTGVSLTTCVARSNGGAGFDVSVGVLSACTAVDNQGAGIDAGPDSSLTGCQAHENDGTGIIAGEGSTLAQCGSRDNAVGIVLGAGSTVDHCAAIRNLSHGFHSAVGCTFTGCTSRLNFGSGFLGGRSTYSACAARENTLVGFDIGGGCTITGCIAQGNQTDGIRVIDDSYVLNNVCEGNGTGATADAAGIHATSSNNRIEGNNCIGNDRGVQADAGGNVVIRNTVAGANPYVMTGTQTIGPIITNRGTVSSNNPWANFEF